MKKSKFKNKNLGILALELKKTTISQISQLGPENVKGGLSPKLRTENGPPCIWHLDGDGD